MYEMLNTLTLQHQACRSNHARKIALKWTGPLSSAEIPSLFVGWCFLETQGTWIVFSMEYSILTDNKLTFYERNQLKVNYPNFSFPCMAFRI